LNRFEFDPAKSAANEAKHGIDFVAAQGLWADPDRVEAPARFEGEPRVLVTGQLSGVLWTAIVTYRGKQNIRLISVRRAHQTEAAFYDSQRQSRET